MPYGRNERCGASKYLSDMFPLGNYFVWGLGRADREIVGTSGAVASVVQRVTPILRFPIQVTSHIYMHCKLAGNCHPDVYTELYMTVAFGALKIEAACSSETSVTTDDTTRHHSNLHRHCRGNFKHVPEYTVPQQ
jgi:hypothetical protein